MTDRQGWHTPNQEETRAGFWTQPENALTPDEITALQAVQEPRPDVEIGAEPVAPGAWYRPDGEVEEPPPPVVEEAIVLDEVVPTMAISAAVQQPALELPLDLGEFDESRSGALTGIQFDAPVEPEEDLGVFDDSRSGVLGGIQPDLGKFDDTRSGQLPGVGAEPAVEAAPAPTFDASRSGQLPGIGQADASIGTGVGGGAALPGIGAADSVTPTQVSSETGVVATPTAPDPFAGVEEKVAILRRQFTDGRITREQLQDELRRLMILDEHGRWWMLGLETNKWYRYDGRSWLPEEPPRPQPAAAAVPTETGVQPVAGVGAQAGASQGIIADPNANIILPNRVPLNDLDATLVGQAAMLDEHRSFEAPTQQGLQFDSALAAGDTVAGSTVLASAMPGVEGAAVPSADEKGGYTGPKMIGIQPDYSEAFGGYFDRANMTKWGLRLFIFGGVGGLVLTFFVILGMLGFYFWVLGEYQDSINNLGSVAGDFQTTIIYDSAGNELAEFNDPRTGARISVPLSDISPYLIHATIATEDETFYENPGFSIFGIVRAIYQNVRTGGGGGGASTITQQLARALVLDADLASQRTGFRKIQEIIIAAEISRKYTKNEILQFYLNEIYYGNLAYGIEAASQVYFQKSAADLNIAEAAFLAGLPQSPAVYDPVQNPQIAKLRMEDVMRLMTEANGDGCIQMQHTPREPFAIYASQPFCVTTADITENFAVEVATVQIKTFTPPSFEARYPHFVNYVYQQLEEEYGQAIYGSGFKVYTTVVPSIQEAAQNALITELSRTPNANNGSIVAVRPRDGAVLAMVGSADFNSDGRSEFNGAAIDGLVNVAMSPQQPGSSIKPLVYLGAIEGLPDGQYWYPGTAIWDVPSTWGTYTPRNYSGTFIGPVSMRYAIGNSLNIPAVKGLAFIGLDKFQEILDRFKIRTPLQRVGDAGLPSAVGAVEVRLYDMTVAYAALANQGNFNDGYAIAYILDRNGNEIYRANENPTGNPVVRPEFAYLMTDILSDEASRFVGAGLDIPGWEEAAKTGTTNEVRDVWAIGYTVEAAVGVWVGNTDNSPMGSGVTSSNTAVPIWQATMTTALSGLNPRGFVVPAGLSQFQVCDYTGAIYTPESCPAGTAETEIALDTQPPPQQTFLVSVEVDSFSGLLANEFCDEYVESRSFVNIDDLTAIAWLRDNPTGQAWAAAHNIDPSTAQPPQEACQPGQPRPRVLLSFPQANATVSGLVEMRGTVDVPNFESYQFQLASAAAPEDFTPPLGQVYLSAHPNSNEFLGAVDFAGIPNGNYILRLSAQNTDDATANVDIPIVVNNTAVPVPTTSGSPLIPTAAPTLTPQADLGGDTTDTTQPTSNPFQAVPPTTAP